MSFDNIIFKVNGIGLKNLEKTLDLLFNQAGHKSTKGFSFDKEKGLVFYWSEPTNEIQKFSEPHNFEQTAKFIEYWLTTSESNKVTLNGFEKDYNDSDVDTDRGWIVYTEDWGKIDGKSYSFFAVKPAYLWYGK